MDFAAAINELTGYMDDASWTVTGMFASPDLTGYERQETPLTHFPVEHIRQRGNGDYGFTGTIYFETPYPDGNDGRLYLRVDYWM